MVKKTFLWINHDFNHDFIAETILPRSSCGLRVLISLQQLGIDDFPSSNFQRILEVLNQKSLVEVFNIYTKKKSLVEVFINCLKLKDKVESTGKANQLSLHLAPILRCLTFPSTDTTFMWY